MPDTAPWTLVDYGYHLDIWIGAEDPDQDLVLEVLSWAQTRMDDPYQGVRREPGFDNLWYGRIPRTLRGDTVVVCSYFILEADRTVRVASIATLHLPV